MVYNDKINVKKLLQISMKNQYLVKLIIIGDCAVGKTNILMRFCENTFKNNYTATIGVDFKVKSIQIAQTKLKIQIWDTAGQQRFRTIAQTYYKGAAAVILTYSVADQNSFNNISKWMKQVKQSGAINVVKVLVANKSDVGPQQRQVQNIQGRALADCYQIPFIQVSAKTGQRIQQLFNLVATKIVNEYIPKLQKQQYRMQLKTQQYPEKQKKKKKDCNC